MHRHYPRRWFLGNGPWRIEANAIITPKACGHLGIVVYKVRGCSYSSAPAAEASTS